MKLTETGLISEFEKGFIEFIGYEIKPRTLGGVRKYFTPTFDILLAADDDDKIVYLGAEHCGMPKKPNMTFLKNLVERKGVLLFGTTFGHYQGVPELRDQEVYEYLGYGAMVLDYEPEHHEHRGVDFVFAEPGDKVVVPSYCNMTIYNLDSAPLVTHDFANPKLNKSSKDLQEKEKLIFSMFYLSEQEKFYCTLNRNYVNADHGFGVEISDSHTHGISLQLPKTRSNSVGKKLHDILSTDMAKEQFARIGVRLRKAQPGVQVNAHKIDKPLAHPEMSETLHKAFLMRLKQCK